MSGEIGEAGEFKNLSRASSSTNFYPEVWRLLSLEHRFVLKLTIWLWLIGGLVVAGSWFLASISRGLAIFVGVVGGIVLLLGVLLTVIFLLLIRVARENFKNGLLTAAIVDSVADRSLIHIAVLSNGGSSDSYVYGILRKDYDVFPKWALVEGRRLACVSTFDDSQPHPNSWHWFQPVPVVFGTRDRRKVERCLDAVEADSAGDGNYFDILGAFLAKHRVPRGFRDMYVCNNEGELIETRSLGRRDKGPAPPKSPPVPRRH